MLSLRTLILILTCCLGGGLYAQMSVAPGDTLYGREWINDGATYLRIPISAEGFYVIGNAELAAAGWSLDPANLDRWQLWRAGNQVPLHVDGSGIYFFGRGNDGALDRFLFANPSDPLNPDYSLYNDTMSYFLGLRPLDGSGVTNEVARFSVEDGDPTGLAPELTITRIASRTYAEHAIKTFIRNQNISIYYSHYDRVEGYGSRPTNDLLSFQGTTVTPFELELPGYAGGEAELFLRFGLGFDAHDQEITAAGQTLGSVQGNGWSVESFLAPFTPNGPSLTGNLTGNAGERDKASLASVVVYYPAQTAAVAGGLFFQLPAATTARRLSFSDAQPGTYALFDRIARRVSFSPQADFRIPATATTNFFLGRLADAQTITAPAPITLNDPRPAQAVDYLIVSSRRLRSAASDPVADYADYRRSAAGGGYRVQVVNVEDLYATHAYGVNRHPLAIRNYAADLAKTYPELKFLFLIGKGREYPDLRSTAQLAAASDTYFLPSFGWPASDNLLSAPVDGVVPRLATGRLSVVSPDEIDLYLNKIRGFDEQATLGQSLEARDWTKQIVHLGGGGVPTEQQSIRNLLQQMANEIENNEYAGRVNGFFKTSSEPIEESREQAIFDRINAGSSIVTFFGHSSSQGFDFNIDNPENYNNAGRYPLMLSLGCYSGDAFTSLRSIGERFVLLPEKGAIAFGASKGLGYISVLGIFARKYYNLLGGERYGQSIGEVLNGTIANFQNQGSYTVRILLEQFGLNGDPTIRLYPRPGPDVVFDPAATTFSPRVIPAQQDSFTVGLRLVNLGRGRTDSLTLELQQKLPSGSLVPLGNYRVGLRGYDADVELRLPNIGFSAVGGNRLLTRLDANNEWAELPAPAAENNNELRTTDGQNGFPFFVVANAARPAYPPPYALWIGGSNVQLTAATTNALAPEQRYFLELDTSQLFQNPLARTEITQVGGLLNWSPTIGWQDSTVYYWRVSPDSIFTEGQGLIWNQSSFTYLVGNNRAGFAVAHQGQANEGNITNIISSESRQAWNFARNLNDIRIRNKLYDPNDTPDWIWNGQEFASPWPWVTNRGVQVMVLDSIRNRDWLRSDGSGAFGSIPHGGTNSPWSFDTRTQAGRAGLMDFIEDGIPAGKYVTLYTAQRGADPDYGATAWIEDSLSLGRTLFGVLESQGAELVRQLGNVGSVPYVFIFQKDIGPLGEALAEDLNSEADITATIAENWQNGQWRSEVVGPALAWEDLELRFLPRNVTETDSVRLRLFGLGAGEGNPVSLQQRWLTLSDSLSYAYDLANIDAAQYPFLRLDLEVFDNLSRTAATLDHAYFHYQRPADVAIDPSVALEIGPDSLAQGQELTFRIGYRNLAPRGMDSLLVRFELNGDGGGSSVSLRQPPLPGGGTGEVSFSPNSTSLSGNTQLQVRLNPDQDQPEQVIFNNDLLREYRVESDLRAPLLDLFFDGVAIREGDLVSARPEILIELRDENEFLPLNDSTTFTLTLRQPDGNSTLITESDERLEFQPATAGGENRARLYFRPEFTQDGEYELRIQAADRSGNPSGRVELVRGFEVITQQRVANVFNYPNPFTDQTQFVYTLTGDRPPEVFRIQVMTVSGRVVYDVDLAQEEALKIGTHRTQFSWRGTDQYGDKLANGVYLYRVITRDSDGQALEKYDNGTDRFFRNEMGKMVILR